MSVTCELAQTYLEQLDLNYIVETMCAEHYPLPRWTREDALQCCQKYKNFLLLQKKNPKNLLVPTKQIDEFWHNHILYTQNYFKDCLNIFGHYFHHVPANPNDDQQQLIADYLQTKVLYLAEFHEPYTLIEGR